LNGEIGITVNREWGYGDINDLRQGGRFAPKTPHELGKQFAFYINEHPFAAIGHISLEVEGSGEVEDKGPEADALHYAFDYDLSPANH